MNHLFIKELSIPQRLLLSETLKKYLRRSHPKYPELEKDIAKRWAGYWGERALANYCKELPEEKYLIFHDLQLQLNNINFQIDTLLISQHSIIIIEAKNIIGTLYFDNVFNQLLRINSEGTEESYEDPRVQCRRLQSLLKRFLVKHGLNMLPIDYLVFFKSANTTILKSRPGDITDFNRVCKARDIFNKIEECEKRFTKAKIDADKMNEIGSLLLSQHTPEEINILKEYSLLEKDLLLGVQCPKGNCMFIPMDYQRGKWLCPKCFTSSKDAHIEFLHDYFLLIRPTMTNQECQAILHLPTKNITQKILYSLNLPTSGHTKNRVYHQWPNQKSYFEDRLLKQNERR